MAIVQVPGFETDCIPLSQAIFQFCIEDNPALEELYQKPLNQLTESDIAELREAPLALGTLTKLLQKETQASKINIDPHKGTFSFCFDSPVLGGPPWAILASVADTSAKDDPRFNAEALFNKEGFVTIADEVAAHYDKRLASVHKATGLVWRQLMLGNFDRAISTNLVTLSARIQSATAPVQGLPADLWPILEVLDWQNRLARDPQGVFYYSIHAASARRRSATVAIAAQESAATKALASELKNHPNLKRAEAFAWCREAGFELNGRGFQQRVWPKARLQAGLAERAQPGRKRNSSH